MRAASKGPFTIPKKRGQKNTKSYGKGKPSKPGYQYKARPKVLNTRLRSDGGGVRYPISVHINQDCDLEIRNQGGRPIDARTRIAKAGKQILRDLVAELGGPSAITFKQRLQLEVVIHRTLVGRSLFERFVKGDESISQKVGATSDAVLLKALDQVYR